MELNPVKSDSYCLVLIEELRDEIFAGPDGENHQIKRLLIIMLKSLPLSLANRGKNI
jgi:hypothetical protein